MVTGANTFFVGDKVLLSGFTNATSLNGAYVTLTAVSPTSYTFSSSASYIGADSGLTNTTYGQKAVDGGVTWMYYGDACPSQSQFTRIMHVYEADLMDPTFTLSGLADPLGPGFPALWIQGNGTVPGFNNWSAGSVGVTGDPCLSAGVCTVGGVTNAPNWLIP